MANFFGEFTGQIGSIWKKLTTGQKMVIMLVSAMLIMGVAAVVYWSNQLEMGVLFGNMNPKDAGAIQAKLEDSNVPYELGDGGQTILVPKDKVYELRNQLTQQGLIQGDGQGMEIFDKMQLGMTEFLQEVSYTRALQGELSRTISWLSQVAAAKVLITRPKSTVFTELEKQPTASVTLKLVPGRTLSQREVMGITNIVASAVEGLDPENVKVIDNKGRLLTKNSSSEEGEMATSQLELKDSYESALTRKAQEQLDTVLGPGKVRIVVNLDLDMVRQTRREKKYSNPEEGKVIKTEKINTEDTSRSSPQSGGATGTGSKLDGETGSNSALADKSTMEDSTKEFAVNEVNLDEIDGGAKINRLTLAIMVDKSLEAQSDDIQGVVKHAVGFDETRGDTASVVVMEFSVPDISGTEEELGSYEQKEFILTMVKHGIQGLSVVAVLLVLLKILKRTNRPMPALAKARPRPGMKQSTPVVEETPERAENKLIREEVLAVVQADPVMATDILHEWLKEE
ncbi:MAG: flagellar basal-body MS-ring/collar protein FliF [Planctomycetota bacterium]